MKRSQTMVASMTIAAAMLLTGCGGGSSNDGSTGGGPGPGTGSATIGGSISGVPGTTTLLLVNKGSDIINTNGSGNFTFDSTVHAGDQYNVTLFTQPTGLTCSIANAEGTIDNNADAVTNIAVTCQSAAVATINYNVGATVSGLLPGNSLTLLLYGSDPLTINANGLAVFSDTLSLEEILPQGAAVTVQSNPTGQSCTVAEGPVSAISSSNFLEVAVACQ